MAELRNALTTNTQIFCFDDNRMKDADDDEGDCGNDESDVVHGR